MFKELSAKKEKEGLSLEETDELEKIIEWIEENCTEE